MPLAINSRIIVEGTSKACATVLRGLRADAKKDSIDFAYKKVGQTFKIHHSFPEPSTDIFMKFEAGTDVQASMIRMEQKSHRARERREAALAKQNNIASAQPAPVTQENNRFFAWVKSLIKF